MDIKTEEIPEGMIPPPPPPPPADLEAPASDRRDQDRERDRDRDRERDRDRGDRSTRKRSRSRDRGDRDREKERERDKRRRSASRERSRREPSTTPPRTRPKPATGWDVFPHQVPGGVKELVSIPNPNAPLHIQQQQLAANPTTSVTAAKTRHARRAYIGNLPEAVSEGEIRDFFTTALVAIGGVSNPGEPILSINYNPDKGFAFLEFRDQIEAANSMALDSVVWRGHTLRVRRPNDYNAVEAASTGPTQPNPRLNLEAMGLQPLGGGGPAEAPAPKPVDEDAENKIFVAGLPQFFTEEQVTEMLKPFGEVKKFSLVKDKATGKSKGYGFAIYMDPSVTDVACAALNGFKLGDRTLTVKRATQGARDGGAAQNQPNQTMDLMAELQRNQRAMIGEPTRIVCLVDLLTPEELGDDQEYQDIFEDMKEMFTQHGLVHRILIPRPGARNCGRVYIEFDNLSQAAKAREAVHGKPFGGKPVVAVFCKEDEYQKTLKG